MLPSPGAAVDGLTNRPARRPGPITPPSLERRLFEQGYLFDFFQAVRIVQRLDPSRVGVGGVGPPRAESVRFKARASLTFPPSSIYDLSRPSAGQSVPVMVEAFMGLTGPSGVLPRHYTELLLRLERDAKGPEKHALRDWFDLFNHRLVSLFYRAWEKYRCFLPYERGEADRPEPDAFTACLYSFVGLGMPPLRNRLRVGLGEAVGGEARGRVLARIEDLTLLHFSGLFAQRPRSAVGLEAIVRDYFLLDARVRQFQGQWLPLEPTNQSCLVDEGGNNQLGVTALAGSRIWDIQNKIRIRLGPLGYDQFLDFLPDRALVSGRKAVFLLAHMVRLYVGAELDFDVQLVLKAADVPECQLAEDDDSVGARLGWNTWICSESLANDADDAVFDGEDVVWLDGDRATGEAEYVRTPAGKLA